MVAGVRADSLEGVSGHPSLFGSSLAAASKTLMVRAHRVSCLRYLALFLSTADCADTRCFVAARSGADSCFGACASVLTPKIVVCGLRACRMN